jgi:CelD/BcsL family acetyltransferase involved in cellulose biosynthesis
MCLKLRYLCSLVELRDMSSAWDDLWNRSACDAPIARAELLALWIETYAAEANFLATVVEADGQFVAALPLIGGRKAKLFRAGMFPPKEWSRCGGLLWDPTAGSESLDVLVRGIQKSPSSVVWLDGVPYKEPRWTEFLKSLSRAKLLWNLRKQDEIGIVDCDGDWETFQAKWSGNHRRHMRKAARKAESEGALELKIVRDFDSAEEVEELVKRGFEVEDRSWKGNDTKTSVLKTPGRLSFFIRQAQQLALWNQLQLVFLIFNGQPIAFEFGWIAKEVYLTPKVGYDESFSRFSPGQLLRYLLYERFHIERSVRYVDFAGELSDATAKWSTRIYPVGRLVFECGSLFGRTLVKAYSCYRGKRASTGMKVVFQSIEVPSHTSMELELA